jgi:hypothetical protein
MKSEQLDQGQDSFLDIIANLVGVLIILVVVVGAQATSSLVAESKSKSKQETNVPEEPTPIVVSNDEPSHEGPSAEGPSDLLSGQIAELETQLSKSKSLAAKLLYDNQLLDQQIEREKQLASQLINRRHAMLTQMAQVRDIADQRKQELDEEQQKKLQLESEEIRLTSELESIKEEINAISTTRIVSEVETIDHYPNPIAKTVFSNEVHFRMDAGRISYVPMDELIQQMKSEIRVKAEKLKQASVTRETVGPIDGFRLQYELGVVAPQRGDHPDARVIRFKRFIVQPVNFSAGEDVDTAMTEGSEFSNVLSRHEPRRTTVSVWVYPNSYDEYSKLKKWLHERGFQMASWPLSKGRPISGGPDGFRTSAQ